MVGSGISFLCIPKKEEWFCFVLCYVLKKLRYYPKKEEEMKKMKIEEKCDVMRERLHIYACGKKLDKTKTY